MNPLVLCIRLPLFRHLFDPSHRETYESAHSVILSIFASYAQRQQHTGNYISGSSTQTSPATGTIVRNAPSKRLSGELNAGGNNKHGPEDERTFTPIISIPNSRKEAEEEPVVSANFMKQLVPFYAQCLIEVGVFHVQRRTGALRFNMSSSLVLGRRNYFHTHSRSDLRHFS